MGTSSSSKPPHYTKLLVNNARTYGYLNGRKIAKTTKPPKKAK